MKDGSVRSLLYMSCLNLTERSADKLTLLPMDMILLDLEDAVPVADRTHARQTLGQHFFSLRQKLDNMALRINSVKTADGLRDLLFLVEHKLTFDLILIPMVEDPQEVQMVRNIMNEHKMYPDLCALIETPLGVENVVRIAGVCDGLFYGGADYCSLVGIDIAKNSAIIDYATSKIVNAAAMYGIPAYDTPCFKMNDVPLLERESTMAARQGFWGKQAIHPQQLLVINQCFTHSDERIRWAKEVLEAARQKNGRISKVNDTMVGPPFFRLAKKILEKATEPETTLSENPVP